MAQQGGDSLLSENDWKRVSQAIQRMEEITIQSTLGAEEIAVYTLLTPRAWPVAIIIQVKYKSPHIDWVQNYESAEEAKRCLTHIWKNAVHR